MDLSRLCDDIRSGLELASEVRRFESGPGNLWQLHIRQQTDDLTVLLSRRPFKRPTLSVEAPYD